MKQNAHIGIVKIDRYITKSSIDSLRHVHIDLLAEKCNTKFMEKLVGDRQPSTERFIK